MTHDRIEFEEPEESVCDCCGGATTSLTRFVTRDGDAFAVYFAKFSNNHPEGWVSVLVGLGDWSEDTDSSQRTAFAFRIWTTDSPTWTARSVTMPETGAKIRVCAIRSSW